MSEEDLRVEVEKAKSGSNPQLIRHLEKAAVQWSEYVTFNTSNADLAIAENVDDLLIRLDEFEHLLDMVQNDSRICLEKHLPNLKEKYSAMQSTFEKIDRLEIMVTRIKHDVDKVDKQLTQAENSAPPIDHTLQPLRALMKPSFIFGRSVAEPAPVPDTSASTSGRQDSSSSPPEVPSSFQPVRIFSTEDFFSKKKPEKS